MNVKATLSMTEKDIELLSRNYAKGKIYIEGLVREQKKISDKCIKEKEKIVNEVDKLRRKLKPYLDGKEQDDEFDNLKRDYEALIIAWDNLDRVINIANESTEAAKLLHIE